MSANKRNIIVKSGLAPVHCFDLWGPIVDSDLLGKISIERYRVLAKSLGKIPENIEKAVSDYVDLMHGEPWATGEKKSGIIDALEGPLNEAGLSPSYADGFQEDGLYVLREILDAGEGVIILSSKEAPKLRTALPEDIGSRLGTIYGKNKSKPESFKEVYDAEQALKRMLVTHTADELPELVAARKSGLFQSGALIYINRNDSNSEAAVREEGIDKYINDLKNVGYTHLLENKIYTKI